MLACFRVQPPTMRTTRKHSAEVLIAQSRTQHDITNDHTFTMPRFSSIELPRLFERSRSGALPAAFRLGRALQPSPPFGRSRLTLRRKAFLHGPWHGDRIAFACAPGLRAPKHASGGAAPLARPFQLASLPVASMIALRSFCRRTRRSCARVPERAEGRSRSSLALTFPELLNLQEYFLLSLFEAQRVKTFSILSPHYA
jgi:hypothetical protein